jgi:ABC-type uncharacterized transport system fused permease/ATPase subunit
MDRLKRIKNETEFNHFNMPKTGEFSLAFNLKKDDFDWLINQAEKLAEIRSMINSLKEEFMNKIQDIEEENNRLKAYIELITL